METSVLIVEDESIVALDLKTRLTSLGFQIAGAARSGAEAQALARETRPDVILMDIQIKGEIDGIETAARIQQDLGIPSIFLTAYSDAKSLERAKRSHAYGYLLKPFQERELLIAIELALYKFAAERELRANRALLDTTVNCIGEGVITTDSERRILLLNDAAQRMTGWSTGSVVGRPLDEILRLTDAFPRGMPETAAGGTGRFVLASRDGRKIPVERTEQTLPEGPPGAASLVVVVRDISESLRYEQSLVAAKEAAESAGRAKSDFMARVTHELRTPLNSIIGMTELAVESGAPAPLHEYLSVVRSSADTLKALISDILDYANYERGQVNLKREIVTVADLVERAARTYAVDAHRKGLRLYTNVDPALPERFYGDEQRLQQTIGNLLSNAVKFTKSGYVRLSVAAGQAERVQFSVEDSGVGLLPEQHGDIFEDFSQLDDPVTRSAGGTGLGLAIVQRLVSAMNGEIRLRSTPGSGSVFTVDLPLTAADARPIGEQIRRYETTTNRDEGVRTRRVFTSDRLLREGLTPWATYSESDVQIVELNPKADFRADDIVLVTTGQYRSFVIDWQENRGAQSPDVSPIVVVIDTVLNDRAHTDMDSFFRPVRIKEPLHTADYAAIAAGRPDVLHADSAVMGRDVQHPILVVDDDTVNLMVTKKMIERLGYSVHGVNRAAAVLEVLPDSRFAAACVDIEMPGMDGWELVKRIRAGEAGSAARSMPMVAVTGHSGTEITDRAGAYGFASVLSKPFTIEQIERTLRDALAGTAAVPAAAPDADRSYGEQVKRTDERPDGGLDGPESEKPVAETPSGVVSLPAADVKRAIEEGNLERAREIVRETRGRGVSTPEAEALFRLQLALRRDDKETAVRLIEELES